MAGKGVAMRAKGLGAQVIVTEVDPIKAIEAHMDGFDVMKMRDASKYGDIFVTVTGCNKVITKEDFLNMKSGAILSNAGHFDVEIDMECLRSIAVDSFEARNNVVGYVLPNGTTIYVIAEGRLVNLAAGDGHPAEIMDMSFAIQAKCAEVLAKDRHMSLAFDNLLPVPKSVDTEIAKLKLATLGCEIDVLSEEQKYYLRVGM